MTDSKKSKKTLPSMLRTRARIMNLQAWFCLAITAGLLIVAGIAVIGAPSIVEQDFDALRSVEQKRESENTIPSDDLYNVKFIGDGNKLIAIGKGGALYSDDNGDTWYSRYSESALLINALAIGNKGKIVVAVGRDGTILFSDDGGKNWRLRQVPGNIDLGNVTVAKNSGNVIAVGPQRFIYYFEEKNSSQEWKQVFTGYKGQPSSVTYIGNSAEKAIVVGTDGLIIYTMDGGKTWKLGDHNIASDMPPLTEVANSEEEVVAVGYNGTIIFSTDSGKTWKKNRKKNYEDDKYEEKWDDIEWNNLNSVAVANDTAIAVGDWGTILYSSEGVTGEWELAELPKRLSMSNFHAVSVSRDGMNAVAVGEKGIIAVSINGGKEWDSLDSGTNEDLYEVIFNEEGDMIVFSGSGSTILFSDLSNGKSLRTAKIRIVMNQEKFIEFNNQINEQVDQAERNKIQSNINERSFDWPFLVQVNSLRFGILLILFFAGHHLLTLVRYKFQMAAFYHARADAIMMTSENLTIWPTRVDDFGKMTIDLSPDGVDFGRIPNENRRAIESLKHVGKKG